MQTNIASMALALPRARHPNRAPFRGVLTLVGSPSDRPPSGARGHRVLLTRAAAERALPSLLGMGLDFTSGYDGHDVRRKVGIITSADIAPGNEKLETGNEKLIVSGFLFARDFPDVLRELRLGAHALGMSYEITDARVRDLRDRIWILDDVTFTGAAILRRDKAAYSETSIQICHPEQALFARRGTWAGGAQPGAASHIARVSPASLFNSQEKTTPMTPELTQQFLETSSRLAVAAESLEQALTRIGAEHHAINSKVDRIIAAVEETEAGAASDRVARLEARIAELERANAGLKARAAESPSRADFARIKAEENISRASARKTLPPLVSALLAKNGLDAGERVDLPTLDKTLAPLSLEQRVAVKAQMARAGIID